MTALLGWLIETNAIVVDHLAAWISWLARRPLHLALAALLSTAAALAQAGSVGPSHPSVRQPPSGPQAGTFLQSGSGATLRTIEARLRDRMSVCDFIGQVCPSGGDDTIAFQAAVTAAATAKAALLIPKGDFKLTAEITVPTNSHIMGTGLESHLFWTGAAINSGLNPSTASDVVIEGLWIEGKTTPSNALTRCIDAQTVTRLTVRNSKFSGCGAADRVSGYRAAINADGADIIIEDNYFTGNGPGTVGGDSHTINFTPTGVPASWTLMTSRIFIRRNRFTGNTDNVNIAIFDAVDIDVTNNWIDQNNTLTINNSGYGILLYGTGNPASLANSMKRARIANNYVTNTAGYGIYLAAATDAVISGNVLRDVVKQQTPIDLSPAGIGLNQLFGTPVSGGVTISGNSIDTSAQEGISCIQCISETIIGNVIQYAVTSGIDVRTSSTDTTAVSNTIVSNGAGNTGILVQTGSTRITLSENAIQNVVNGVNLVAVNDNLVVDNRINASTNIGVQASSTSTRNVIARNWVTNSTSYGAAEGSATNYYFDNFLIGNTAGPYNLNASQKRGNITTSGGVLRGTVVLAAANPAATVAVGEVRTGDQIRINRQTVGGTPGHFSIGTITNLTSFTIVASGNLDTSTVEWEIVH